VTVYLVRHARAGSRRAWQGEDDLRPLSRSGHQQAERIADALVAAGGGQRVISSPYVRCRQTVDPIAQRLRLPLELSDALAEGAPATDTMRLIDKVLTEDATVLCTHGDVVENVLHELALHGVPLDDDRLDKASVWVLDAKDGEIVGGHYVPPPD